MAWKSTRAVICEEMSLAQQVVVGAPMSGGEAKRQTQGGHHRRGKKRTHKSYYEMTEKER